MPKKKLDLAALFEKKLFAERSGTAPYKTFEAELDGVRTRRKGMSMLPWTRGYIAQSAEFVEVVDKILDRGLALVLHPDEPIKAAKEHQSVHAFVLHLDQAWRVLAFRALWNTFVEVGGPWSDAQELHEGALLGYTLLTHEHRRHIEALGQRCLGPADFVSGMTFFEHAGQHPLKRNAARLVGRDLTIARIALDRQVVREILGDPRARKTRRLGVITGSVTPSVAKTINSALRGNVEFLGAKGWSDGHLRRK